MRKNRNINESLPRQRSVDQLKKLRKLTKGTDIGDRVQMKGANKEYDRNPIDTGIESYEDFEKRNKDFVPSWNLKNMISPFKGSKKIKKVSESLESEKIANDILPLLKDKQDKGYLVTDKYYFEFMYSNGYDNTTADNVYHDIVSLGFNFDIENNDNNNSGDELNFTLKTV